MHGRCCVPSTVFSHHFVAGRPRAGTDSGHRLLFLPFFSYVKFHSLDGGIGPHIICDTLKVAHSTGGLNTGTPVAHLEGGAQHGRSKHRHISWFAGTLILRSYDCVASLVEGSRRRRDCTGLSTSAAARRLCARSPRRAEVVHGARTLVCAAPVARHPKVLSLLIGR